MKRFLGTRIGVIIITLIICSIVFGGFTYAASFSKDVPTSGMVLKASPGLTLYSDAACTTEITTLTFPNVAAGYAVALSPVFLKNTGNKDFTSVTGTSTMPSTIGSIAVAFTSGNFQSMALAKNVSVEVHLTMTTLLNGVTEDTPVSCSTVFSGNYN